MGGIKWGFLRVVAVLGMETFRFPKAEPYVPPPLNIPVRLERFLVSVMFLRGTLWSSPASHLSWPLMSEPAISSYPIISD